MSSTKNYGTTKLMVESYTMIGIPMLDSLSFDDLVKALSAKDGPLNEDFKSFIRQRK